MHQNSHTTDKLHFNFGFLLTGHPGESTRVELAYPAVKLDDIILRPLKGYFKASRTAQGIFLKGKLITTAQAICARCNDEFAMSVDLYLDDHYYVPAVAPVGEFTIGDSGILNLGPLVRELSITALPLQPVCKEDCQGLCIECGQNLNVVDCGCEPDEVDPRMAVLKQLLDN